MTPQKYTFFANLQNLIQIPTIAFYATVDTFNLFGILCFRLELPAASRCDIERALSFAEYQRFIFIIKGTTDEKLFFIPLNHPLSQKRVEHLTMPSLSDYLRTPIRL